MKNSFIIFFAFYFISKSTIFIKAGEYIVDPHPQRKPGLCYDETLLDMKPGEEKRLPKVCVLGHCNENGSITFYGCGGIIREDPDCDVVREDLSKVFPGCCPIIECKRKYSN